MAKRFVEIAIISDVHLGTFGCHAKELLNYLKCIKPKTLLLNGDIIDIWNFRKNYFPGAHMKVLKQIMHMASKGTKVYYITGNHDELLRKFTDTQIGNIKLCNKHLLEVNGKKAWVFHGDVFDRSIQGAKMVARLGGMGYDLLILINRFLNVILEKFGREKYSFSKKIKNSVKKAVKFISDFEETASELAIEQGFDYVICGHIHQPQIRQVENKKGSVLYLNSGDWVENLTALEFHNNQWRIYQYDPANYLNSKDENKTEDKKYSWEELMELVNPVKHA